MKVLFADHNQGCKIYIAVPAVPRTSMGYNLYYIGYKKQSIIKSHTSTYGKYQRFVQSVDYSYLLIVLGDFWHYLRLQAIKEETPLYNELPGILIIDLLQPKVREIFTDLNWQIYSKLQIFLFATLTNNSLELGLLNFDERQMLLQFS